MRRIWFGLHLLIAFVISLVASGIALAQVPSSIQIFMPNGGGTPSRSIRLTLARDDGFIDTVFTDSKGKFQIDTPRNGAAFYTVTIETDRQTYATTTATFRLYPGTPNETAIFLRPLAVEKLPANAALDVTNFEGAVPAKARAAYKRGMDFVSAGDLQSGIGSLQEAISLYPQYVRALNDLGVIFLKLNRLDEAAVRFRNATEISKRFFHARLNLGLVLTKQEKYREALEVLEPLYSENHGMVEVRLAYATALQGAAEFSEAEKVYRSTLSTKNLTSQVRAEMEFGLGAVLNHQGRFADAAYHLEEAIKLDQDNANSHLQLGGALMQLQELERAETELLRAYELGGKLAGGAQLLLGHIYYGERKFEDAQRAFEQYLKDVPSAPNASQITKLIADLKATPRN
jgi:tetratricopeptide (TPR) repeat protein